MKILDTPLAGLKVVESVPYHDPRGGFTRLFCAREMRTLLGRRQIAQINLSTTHHAGAVRGLHYQYPPHAEVKMVRCLRGRIWDVAVDLRAGSPTFLHWYAWELTPESATMMVIPEGYAHGFQALEAGSELLYVHTEFYTPESEAGLRHDDPRLGIDWPLVPQDLSARDLTHPPISRNFTGVTP